MGQIKTMRPSPSSAVTGKAELLEQGALSALPGGGEKADQAPLPLFPAARVRAHGSKHCSSNARNCSMPKAAVQDQAHSAAICPLPLASLDHRGLGNVCPDFTRTLVCGSGKIRADSGQSPGGGGWGVGVSSYFHWVRGASLILPQTAPFTNIDSDSVVFQDHRAEGKAC